MDDKYQEMLEVAVDDLAKAVQDRDEFEKRLEEQNSRIESLREIVRGLCGMCGVEYEVEYAHLLPANAELEKGLTDRVRSMIKDVIETRYSAIKVRDELRDSGYGIDKYSNGLATIHTILRRLHKAGEIEIDQAMTAKEGRTYYYAPVPF